jgi:membrane protein
LALYIRWAVAIGCTILAVELLYFVAPNVKQRFLSTLPGSLIAVGGWIGLSYLLGIYFQDFAAYSKGYGSLRVALAFSIWLYWIGFVILIGAQFNAELLHEARGTFRATQVISVPPYYSFAVLAFATVADGPVG